MKEWVLERLRCPACVRVRPTRLVQVGDMLKCSDPDCRATYPIVDGRPILFTRSGDYHGILPKPGSSTHG